METRKSTSGNDKVNVRFSPWLTGDISFRKVNTTRVLAEMVSTTGHVKEAAHYDPPPPHAAKLILVVPSSPLFEDRD